MADHRDDPEHEAPARGGAEEAEQDLAGLRVLVAEDDRISMIVARELVTRAGAVLIEARNGEEAFQEALSQRPDVALLDVQMPVVDGIEAARRLREHRSTRDLPLIAMTAGALHHRREELDALFDAVVQKPYERGQLIDAIRAVTLS